MIVFSEFYKGISKSKSDLNGLDSMINCDVSSEFGLVRPQLALTAESGTYVPDEPCYMAVTPAATIYFFSSSSGKIWKRTTDGTYSSVTANSNTLHTGARYFSGKVYYWTTSKIGRFDPETEGTRNNAWATASNGGLDGAAEINLALYIADNEYITQINASHSFTANALDLPSGTHSYSLIAAENNLLIGAHTGSGVQRSVFYLWDTYSDSWTLEDLVPEDGANTFISCDNLILTQCGTAGKLYYWTGTGMSVFEGRIRDDTTAIGHQLSTVLNGKPLFATVYSNKIYSIHKQYASTEFAIVREYTTTVSGIKSILALGTQLFVSHASGVNKIGTTYATAVIDTPEVSGNFNNVVVDYDYWPSGIGISTKINNGDWTEQTPIIDAINRKIYFDGGLADCQSMQARITLTPSGSSIPRIKSITLQ